MLFDWAHPFLDIGESAILTVCFGIVGLLWRVTIKLTSITTLLHEHERRLNKLEKS